jgi:sialic acid synthase SpsE
LISAFNKGDAQYISELGIKEIKIPSHEVANKSLHEYSAKNFDKVFVSLGAGRPSEIELAASIYNAQPGLWWVGMHCVSSYPCPDENANLPRINYLAKLAKIVGYSDHTTSILTPSISLAYGARVIEKHFTVDKNLPGRDNKFALDPDEFRSMVKNIRVAGSALIDHGIDAMSTEKDTMENYRGRWGS